MIDKGKKNLLGVLVDAVDYEAAIDKIITAAKAQRPLAVSALAVHGVMTGVLDLTHRYRLNHFDLVVSDGQPVRWGLNLLHGAALPDRVYGPTLTLKVCAEAAASRLPIYLYGSHQHVLDALARALRQRFPDIQIAGMEPSRFRRLTADEKEQVVEHIRKSGARIVLVGLGCPRQEVWAYEYRDFLGIPILAVGAAFDFHAGTLPQAPSWMQRMGLEWLFRLGHEPKRLWRRYLYLNPTYLGLATLQLLRIRRIDPGRAEPPRLDVNYG